MFVGHDAGADSGADDGRAHLDARADAAADARAYPPFPPDSVLDARIKAQNGKER